MLSCFSSVQLFTTRWTESSVLGILQARILDWAVIPFSRGGDSPTQRLRGEPKKENPGAVAEDEGIDPDSQKNPATMTQTENPTAKIPTPSTSAPGDNPFLANVNVI